jgi:hypothetical protein
LAQAEVDELEERHVIEMEEQQNRIDNLEREVRRLRSVADEAQQEAEFDVRQQELRAWAAKKYGDKDE